VLWQLGVRAIEERPHSLAVGGDDDRDSGESWVELWTAVGDEPEAIARAAAALVAGGSIGPSRWPTNRRRPGANMRRRCGSTTIS
jgi:hypothetical protein